jgi:hypothetical protein
VGVSKIIGLVKNLRKNEVMKMLERMMFWVIPNCRETQKLQSRNLDVKLSLWKRGVLWMHCVMCGWCRRYGKQINFLNRICSELPECGDFEEEEKMPKEARERVEKCLCEKKS